MQQNDDIQKKFLEDLLLEVGYTQNDNLPKLIAELEPILSERIYQSLEKKLSEKQKSEIEKLLDQNKDEETIVSYIQNCFEDYQGFLLEILGQFRKEYLEAMKNDEE